MKKKKTGLCSPKGLPPGPSSVGRQRQTKTDATRAKIIGAARKVFTQYPYHAASLRMIGQQGGFTHSYIHYHFRTKAQLFEAVGQQLYEEYLAGVGAIVEDAGGVSLREALSRGVERFVDYGFRNPDAFHILMLNIGETDHFQELIGGLQYLQQFQEDIRKIFAAADAFHASARWVNMWISCFNIVSVSYLGAARFYIRYLNMKGTEPYRTFVRETLELLSLAPLECLFSGGTDRIRRLPVKQRRPGSERRKGGKTIGGEDAAPSNKGAVTRKRILDVSRHLFTRKAYNTVGIRMIGDEGGFDATLLYHYFANKGELFEAVAMQLLDEYKTGIASLLEGLTANTLRENMTLLVNRGVDYFSKHPDVLLITMQNIAQIDTLEEIPGAHHVPMTIMEAQRMLEQVIGTRDKRIYLWFYALCIVLFNCLGASTYHAHVLGMDPKGARYRRWVKDMAMFIFYPVLETIALDPSDGFSMV